ncbi:MAG TPA: YggS family pyridoxal phosphate-dependent enzyme [Nitrospirota bacterium]|nr:YggS family pyridoxal phosphate-dependent enzyme [Nitrospirota bacterium]
MSISDNLKKVMDRIASAARRAGRDPASIKLIAVTKTVDIERIREAVAAGTGVLGENRVQEAKEKIEQLGPLASWHLIGHLQSNKAKYAVKLFDLIHSIDSFEVAQEVDKQAAKVGKIQDVLVEVNISGEASKAGITAVDAANLIEKAAVLKNLSIKGLMTIPPFFDNAEEARPYFKKLRDLSVRIGSEKISRVSMGELSMGMSGDFEVAVEEGATMVRVGTAIFGGRS